MPREPLGPLYLTLDQGGHASRALVFDAHGQLLVKGLREVRVHHPRPDWVEQDPEELVLSVRAAVGDALDELGPNAQFIVAVGLATQRSSVVCWDRTCGLALSPVLSWQDRRAHAWLQRFAAHADLIQATTGLPLSAHYGASKLHWCLHHLPAVMQAQAEGRLAFGPLASFLTYRCTDERPIVVDPANGGRSLLCNLQTRDWDAGLLHLFDIPRVALPACVPTRYDFGKISANRRSIPLTVVTGDQSAAVFAHGQPSANHVYINIGTGAFVQRVVAELPSQPSRLLRSVVLQDSQQILYALEGTVNGAGAALQWIESELDLEDLEQQLPRWLADTHEPPFFLNGVGGLGAPFWVADFESRFSMQAEPWLMAVAVVESIVFLLQVNLELLQELPPSVEKIIASGGLTRYDGLCQRLSDLSGLPLYRPFEYEATARGTAWLLAGKPAVWREPQPGLWFQPRTNLALRARYQRWRAALEAALAA